MMRREGHDPELAAALDAYRAAAHAEADALFDDRALDAQRQKILARLEHAGQQARVLPFPVAPRTALPVAGVSRRWISVAAAAGLIVGLLTGQWLHILPGDTRRTPSAGHSLPEPAASRSVIPAVATADDDLLDAIETAVRLRSISELRALDDLTFSYEPR